MIKLQELQGIVQTLIKAEPLFTNLEVIVNNGLSWTQIETALRTVGACVSIEPIQRAISKDQNTRPFGGQILALANAEVLVRIYVNPEINSIVDQGAGLDIYLGVSKLINAVLKYIPGLGDKGFFMSEECLALSNYDVGLFSYDIYFLKTCSLT